MEHSVTREGKWWVRWKVVVPWRAVKGGPVLGGGKANNSDGWKGTLVTEWRWIYLSGAVMERMEKVCN